MRMAITFKGKVKRLIALLDVILWEEELSCDE